MSSNIGSRQLKVVGRKWSLFLSCCVPDNSIGLDEGSLSRREIDQRQTNLKMEEGPGVMVFNLFDGNAKGGGDVLFFYARQKIDLLRPFAQNFLSKDKPS
jgi:hypothetical protein